LDIIAHSEERLGAFLQGRPKKVAELLSLRQSRGETMACSLTVVNEERGQFLVRKSDDTLKTMHHDDLMDREIDPSTSLAQYIGAMHVDSSHYTVDILAGQCSCPDNLHLRMPCKHMFMIFKHTKLSFADLPATLTNTPRMVIDQAVIKVMFIEH
jgi:hypothetical protein